MSVHASLPPDRGHVRTELRHERSIELDAMDTRSFVALMAEDHRAVNEAIMAASEALANFIEALVPRMRPPSNGRLIYVGAGTSGRLGVLDASECPPTFQSDPGQVVGIIAGGDASLRRSSEGMEDDATGAAEALQELGLNGNDTLLGIAAGGTTPYVLGAMDIAHSRGALTGLLTCAWMDGSPALRAVSASRPPPGSESRGTVSIDHIIHLPTGPELLTGSTRLKAGSATKLALNIISTAVFVQLGKVYSNLMVDLRATNAKLQDRALRILIEVCPELSRQEAATLLQRAGGHVKSAIVMQRLDVDSTAAAVILEKSCGSLRRALEQVSSSDEDR